jgi:hypothetical protein
LRDGLDIDNPVKGVRSFSRCRTNSYFIRSKSDVCRNAKITSSCSNSTISTTIPSTSKVEHDIDDIPELKDWNERPQYELCDGTRPISYSILSKQKRFPSIHEQENSVHILRYTNQPCWNKVRKSFVVAEIIRKNYGRLKVPTSSINLQSS